MWRVIFQHTSGDPAMIYKDGLTQSEAEAEANELRVRGFWYDLKDTLHSTFYSITTESY